MRILAMLPNHLKALKMIQKFPPSAVQKVGEGDAALYQVDLSRGKPVDLWQSRYSAAFLACGSSKWSDQQCIESFGLLNSAGTQPVAEYKKQREALGDIVGSLVGEQMLPPQWLPASAERTYQWFGQLLQLHLDLRRGKVEYDPKTRRLRLARDGTLYEQLVAQGMEFAGSPREPRPCAYCEMPFFPKKADQQFCSPSCRTMAARRRADA